MRNFEVKPALEALKKIDLSQIGDKEIKNQLLNLALALLSVNRTMQQQFDDARTAILGPFQDSFDEINLLKREAAMEKNEAKKQEFFAKIEAHTEVLAPTNLLNEKINEILQQEVLIKGIKKDDFIAAVSDLKGFDFSVIEGLFPALE